MEFKLLSLVLSLFASKEVDAFAGTIRSLSSFSSVSSGRCDSPVILGSSVSSSSSSSGSSTSSEDSADSFIVESFASECDDFNRPPSLNILLRSVEELTSHGSDVRGRFVDHPRLGSITRAAQAIAKNNEEGAAPLTPIATYCLGYAFGQMMLQRQTDKGEMITIAIGQDPRSHGRRLSDAFARGVQSADASKMKVLYTGLATTPSMSAFCRANLCDGGVMVTASHLPVDKNGLKFFTKEQGGFERRDIQQLGQLASNQMGLLHDRGQIPPASGSDAVYCSEWVDFMPNYANDLKSAILKEVGGDQPLEGLKIVLNSGNGSGGFFNQVIKDLGADVSGSIHLEADSHFPNGVPNPECKKMVQTTIDACFQADADLGIMFDTDADRCGFVVKTYTDDGIHYEPLNRNRLIALLSVMFSKVSPGCAIVTDSVTSEGLSKFLTDDLKLNHVRYLKGYANVIGKARELSSKGIANAEVAIETSGHCAMQENDYLDDGTYTAVKIVSLLAQQKKKKQQDDKCNVLDLIQNMEECNIELELRMKSLDGSLNTMLKLFDIMALEMEHSCEKDASLPWEIDTENLEGIRLRCGTDGSFFMLRKSLHDPIISLQVEGNDEKDIERFILRPLLQLFQSIPSVQQNLDLSAIEKACVDE